MLLTPSSDFSPESLVDFLVLAFSCMLENITLTDNKSWQFLFEVVIVEQTDCSTKFESVKISENSWALKNWAKDDEMANKEYNILGFYWFLNITNLAL